MLFLLFLSLNSFQGQIWSRVCETARLIREDQPHSSGAPLIFLIALGSSFWFHSYHFVVYYCPNCSQSPPVIYLFLPLYFGTCHSSHLLGFPFFPLIYLHFPFCSYTTTAKSKLFQESSSPWWHFVSPIHLLKVDILCFRPLLTYVC